MATILVVEDDEPTRGFLRAILEGDGHTVLEAASGADALKRLERGPALVLLNLGMPGAPDGYQVVSEIRRRGGPFLPIILLSEVEDPAVRARGIEVGADDILGKPVHPFELRLRVRAMLRIQQLAGELHVANRRLRLLARTDELTGLGNRRALKAALLRELRRAQRYGSELTIVELDVDRFKQVNDGYGHGIGDRVLQAVARALGDGLREVDMVARSGGEEFVVVMPETPLVEGMRVAERLRARVARVSVPLPGDGGSVTVSISAGVASLRGASARSPDDLLQAADAALYQAKALGRNRVVAAEVGAQEEEHPKII